MNENSLTSLKTEEYLRQQILKYNDIIGSLSIYPSVRILNDQMQSIVTIGSEPTCEHEMRRWAHKAVESLKEEYQVRLQGYLNDYKKVTGKPFAP